jgi:biotin carboxyl carrier protein
MEGKQLNDTENDLMQELKINIEDRIYDAAYDEDNFQNVFINDKLYKIELLKKYASNIFTFSVNQKLLQVELELDDQGNVIINYDGLYYNLQIKDKTRYLLERFVKDTGVLVTAGITVLKAPMPGLIVKILKSPGEEVVKGDKILIVEAMKMENAISSPITGKIKKINVKESQAVEKDAVLAEIEE